MSLKTEDLKSWEAVDPSVRSFSVLQVVTPFATLADLLSETCNEIDSAGGCVIVIDRPSWSRVVRRLPERDDG